MISPGEVGCTTIAGPSETAMGARLRSTTAFITGDLRCR
jgi:hypothetical protein